MAIILEGRSLAQEIEKEIKSSIESLNGRKPCLAVLLVGHDPASHVYVGRKVRQCAAVGILSIRKDFPPNVSEAELLAEISALNVNPEVDGILVQMPLPDQINSYSITMAIDPNKDVDGFHPVNLGQLLSGNREGFVPCTPLGIHQLLLKNHIPVEGKHVVIIGRSNIVGRPMAALLLQNAPGCNATVTVVHRFTPDLRAYCLTADILISAIGKPGIITAEMVKEGGTIIDVGINKIDDPSHDKGYRLIGDVDFEQVKQKCSYITPVPGGVGPLTIAMLLKNCWRSYQRRAPFSA